MIESFVRNPVKVTVGVLLLVLFGIIGLVRMPMQLTPEVEIPTITVQTNWPGRDPEDVETEIINPQEEQLKSVEGVVKMTSNCTDGAGTITLEFPVGIDMTQALLMVNTRLQQVREYPPDAREPIISTSDANSRPIGWFMLRPRIASPKDIEAFQQEHPELSEVLEPAREAPNSGLRLKRLQETFAKHPEIEPLMPPDIDITTYRKFAEDFIEARFERVQGVANANVLGGREEELQVIINPEKLASRGLTIAHVRDALQAENQDTSAGDFWEGKRRWTVRTMGRFRNPEDVRNVIIATGEDGQPVYVRDIVQYTEDGQPMVDFGYKKPDGKVKQFGHTSIAINVERAVGANVLDVMDGLRDATAHLNDNLLRQRGLQLEQVYDETDYIYASINLVRDNIFIGGLLTVIVLLIFLRDARSTLVIMLTIPSSIIGTFVVMSALGRSLNVISMAGLAFAVGMLVDNAVVVLENVYSHYQRGKSPLRAAVDGTTEVMGAVISSTLTTLAVFIPVLFVEEQAGQLFRDIALAVSAGVGLSLILSLTLIPMASSRLLRSRTLSTTPSTNGTGPGTDVTKPRRRWWIDILGSRFCRLVSVTNAFLQERVWARLVTVFGFVGVALFLCWLLMPQVEYLPSGNRNLVFGIVLPPPGYNLDQLEEIGRGIETRMRPYWDVDANDPEGRNLDYPPLKDFFYVARGRQVFLGVKARDDMRAGEMVNMVRDATQGIPGTFAVAKQSSLFERGLTSGRTVDVEITGPEIDTLLMLGGRVMGQIPSVIPDSQALPKPSLDKASPEMLVTPRREQAAQLQLSSSELGYSVDALLDGAYAGDFYKGSTRIDLTIIGIHEYGGRTQDVKELPLVAPGSTVPVQVESVARVEESGRPEQINHSQRQRSITIEVSPPETMALEEAMARIQREIILPLEEEGLLGDEYQIELAGTADKLRSTWSALQWNFLLALLITYLLMAALFESWLYPFVVILSVPLGALGGFLGLWLLNLFILQPLDVLTMLGFVILIGTVVNNPILIVEQSLVNIREGKHYRVAVQEATRSRVRPIFMTTLTTTLGLCPLVLFPGSGSELYRGIGSVLLGGLMVSTMVTLVLVPSVFSLMLELKAWILARLGVKAGEIEVAEQADQAESGDTKVEITLTR